eukprot:Clim_evm10s234 gene=Clim_evmTU10s234
MATSTVERRVMREYQQYTSKKDTHHRDQLRLEPCEDNILEWNAWLQPQGNSLYSGGTFRLHIDIPKQYPIKPPKIRFVTPVCHPNIHFQSGEICMDILANAWSPAWNIQSTCLAILLLLDNPEISSPLNCDAANLLRCEDKRGYRSLVSYYVRSSARHPDDIIKFQALE